MTTKRPTAPALRPHRLPRATTRPLAAAGRASAPLRRFLRETRAASGIAAALLTAGVVAGGALVVDHVWLYDQRDLLKTAAEAGAVAATLELERQLLLDPNIKRRALKRQLNRVAERYVRINLGQLSPEERLRRAKDTLDTEIVRIDRAERTVEVQASADLGGTFFSRYLPLLGGYKGPDEIRESAKVDSDAVPAEVVLAIDVSGSMQWDLKREWWKGEKFNAKIVKTRMEIVKDAAKDLVDAIDPNRQNQAAVGLVPWQQHVRLDEDTVRHWAGKAHYPTRRRYEFPYFSYCDGGSPDCFPGPSRAVEEELPPNPPEDWLGCLGEERLGAGRNQPPSLPSRGNLLALPAKSRFAQAFFPSRPGLAYQCMNFHDFPANFSSQHCFKPPSGVELEPKPLWGDWAAATWWRDGKVVHRTYIGDHEQYWCADSPTIVPLSYDAERVRKAIDKLQSVPNTYTHSALGILWSRRLLEPKWKREWAKKVRPPRPHPVDLNSGNGHNARVRKAIVLLTDGEDTQCGLDDPGCEHNRTLGIPRSEACKDAKLAGIEIFVIAAMHPDQISGELGKGLEECSSQADNPDGEYVFLENHDEEDLKAAFVEVARQLRILRRVF